MPRAARPGPSMANGIGGAEQHDLGAGGLHGCLDPAAHVGRGPQEPLGLAEHLVGHRSIERIGLVPVGAEHRDTFGREFLDQRLEGALDPTHARRVVVGDEQGARNVHGEIILQSMGPLDAPPEQLTALEAGRAFVDLSALRTRSGSPGRRASWLHDLVTDGRGIPRPWAGTTFPAADPHRKDPGRLHGGTRRGGIPAAAASRTGRIHRRPAAPLRAVVGRDAARPHPAALGLRARWATPRSWRPVPAWSLRSWVRARTSSWRAGSPPPGNASAWWPPISIEVGWDAREVWRIRRWAAPDGTGLRRGFPAVRSGPRCHDRCHQGLLPRPGIGGQGPQPRPPPERLAAGRRTVGRRCGHGRGGRRRTGGRRHHERRGRLPTAPARPRSSASDGRRQPPICAPPTASIWSPSARWTSPFVSFPVPLPGKEGLRAFDPFRCGDSPLL